MICLNPSYSGSVLVLVLPSAYSWFFGYVQGHCRWGPFGIWASNAQVISMILPHLYIGDIALGEGGACLSSIVGKMVEDLLIQIISVTVHSEAFF